jgi:hypothetical protein
MMVEGDPRIPLSDNPDRTEERMVDALTLNEREAMILVRPLGVLMAGTKINAKVGRKIVDAAPLLDSAAVAAATDATGDCGTSSTSRRPPGPPPPGITTQSTRPCTPARRRPLPAVCRWKKAD